MSQPRKWSFAESVVNVVVGLIVAMIAQFTLWPLYGIHVEIRTNFWLSVWFTAISLIRSYCLRRFFNRRTDIRS